MGAYAAFAGRRRSQSEHLNRPRRETASDAARTGREYSFGLSNRQLLLECHNGAAGNASLSRNSAHEKTVSGGFFVYCLSKESLLYRGMGYQASFVH